VRFYVVRHGPAEAESPDGSDAARRLTPAGRAKVRRIARGLRRLRVRAAGVLTSPLPRAAETAAILAAEHGKLPQPVELPALATGTGALSLLKTLSRHPVRGDLMIVGHEPVLSQLVAVLLTGSPDGLALELKKGGVVAVECDRLAPRRATLLWMSTPRALRRLGRRRVSAARRRRAPRRSD